MISRRRNLRAAGVVSAFALLGLAEISAQVNPTAQVRLYGSAGDDRIDDIVPWGAGALVVGSTESAQSSSAHAFVARLDQFGDTMWVRTVFDGPLTRGISGSVLSSQKAVVLLQTLGEADTGYDLSWFVFSVNGTLEESFEYGTPSWDLPVAMDAQADTAWTLLTSYATGAGDLHVLKTYPNAPDQGGGWTVEGPYYWGHAEVEEQAADLVVAGDSLRVSATRYTATGSQALVISAAKPTPASQLSALVTDWTWQAGEGTTAGALSTKQMAEGHATLLAFTRESADGGTQGDWVHLSSAGVEEALANGATEGNQSARHAIWNAAGEVLLMSWSDIGGLGGTAMMCTRWTPEGSYLTGASFGSETNEWPARWMRLSDGRLWAAGASDGYSNGSRDGMLLMLPADSLVSDYTMEVVDLTNTTLINVPSPPDDWHLSHAAGELLIAPNPSRALTLGARLSIGTRPNSHLLMTASWAVHAADGRWLLTGSGVDLPALPSGSYFVIVRSLGRTNPHILPWIVL